MVIVVAIDGEQRPAPALAEGYELGTNFGDELIVVHVMDQDIFDRRRQAIDGSGSPDSASVTPVVYGDQRLTGTDRGGSGNRYTIENAEADAADIARETLDETLDDWDEVTCQGRVGEPVREILEEARRLDARYLVIGGRKRSPIGKAVFGSITQSILLEADRPVVAVMGE